MALPSDRRPAASSGVDEDTSSRSMTRVEKVDEPTGGYGRSFPRRAGYVLALQASSDKAVPPAIPRQARLSAPAAAPLEKARLQTGGWQRSPTLDGCPTLK
jgi:hypothetical protein